MILVDTSVWIANLRGEDTEPVRKLGSIEPARQRILVGDLILAEVLMGARDEAHAARLRRDMQTFPIVSLVGADVAEEAARNWRRLRALGITVRGTIDMLIGTFCILHGHTLLHGDRDFLPMQRHLGLAAL